MLLRKNILQIEHNSVVTTSSSGGNRSDAPTELKGYLCKLPTWQRAPTSNGIENQYKLRFFVVAGGVISYYSDRLSYEYQSKAGGAISLKGAVVKRESKLEFSVNTYSQRLFLRAMSEAIALNWLATLVRNGAAPYLVGKEDGDDYSSIGGSVNKMPSQNTYNNNNNNNYQVSSQNKAYVNLPPI